MPYQHYRARTSHAARVLADVDAQRHQHARSYLMVVWPGIIVAGVIMLTIGWATAPAGTIRPEHLVALATMVVSLAVIAVLSRRFDTVKLALVAIGAQSVVIFMVVVTSRVPEQHAILLVWPLIALAYFGRPKVAGVAGFVMAAALVVLNNVANWESQSPVPVSAYVIAVAGLLMAFVTREGRLVELSLVSTMTRDHLALSVARGMRMSEDPHAALVEIARAIGIATESHHTVAIMFEHDDDYIADLATWTDPTMTSLRPSPDLSLLDSTLRHLLISCHGAVTDDGTVRLVTMPDELHAMPPASEQDQAVTSSMQLMLETFDTRSGMLIPLPLGSRAIGAILLMRRDPHDWTSHALPVLDRLTSQLAAGLAQVVLLRDQSEALDSLERLNRMRDRLIANVSHELRTPLTSTIGFIETLLRTDVTLTEEQRGKLMTYARDGGMRLLALVEDLLALGSTRPESLDLDPSPVHLGELLETTLRDVHELDGRTVSVEMHAHPAVIADRNRLLQVMANLIMNAVRHGEGDIVVRVSEHDGCAIVDVLDAGSGVAEEHLDELFLPFARFSTRSDSTGLGLAICRTIVEAHNGTIEYDREDGNTRFQVRLPLADA